MKIIFVSSILLILMVGCSHFYHPSDRALEERFNTYRVEFEELVRVFKEDPHLKVVSKYGAIGYDEAAAPIPQRRFEEYRRLLRKLNLANINRPRQGEIYLKASFRNNLLMGGSSKGYCYCETPQSPAALTDSLDHISADGGEGFGYRKIVGDWYIFYDGW